MGFVLVNTSWKGRLGTVLQEAALPPIESIPLDSPDYDHWLEVDLLEDCLNGLLSYEGAPDEEALEITESQVGVVRELILHSSAIQLIEVSGKLLAAAEDALTALRPPLC